MEYKSTSYRKAFAGMRNSFGAYVSRNGIENSQIEDMGEWLFTVKRNDITSDSWRLYRAALLSTVEMNPEIWNRESLDKLKVRLYEKSDKSMAKKKDKRTAKNLTQADLNSLSDELKSPKRTYGISTLLWFKSSLLTGLRPNEWMGAEIISIENEECLKVKNLKVMEVNFASLTKETSGRSRFLYRTIPLDGFSTSEKKVIRAWVVHLKTLTATMMERLSMSKESAQKALYERCRSTLYSAHQQSCPGAKKGVSLYTARHIFKVNNKQKLIEGGMTQAQADVYMAILMGHGSTKSNYAYGDGVSDTDASTINIEKLGDEKENFLRRVLTKYD